MKVKTQAWKVLTTARSSYATDLRKGGLYYPKGKWVRPRISKSMILVFDTVDYAVKFLDMHRYSNGMIVPCEILYAKLLSVIGSSLNYNTLNGYKNFWFYNFWKEENRPYYYYKAPFGTLGCRACKCLE